MKDPWSIVLGAALALIATAAVQRWLIPDTQAKTRQRERWEKDVRELADLLAKHMLPALFELSNATYTAVELDTEIRSSPHPDHKRNQASVKAKFEEHRRLTKDYDSQMGLVEILANRLEHLNSDADGWSELNELRSALVGAWNDFYVRGDRAKGWPSTETVDETELHLSIAIEKMSRWVEGLAKLNKPPKRPAVHRRMWRRVRRLRLADQNA
ncbi:hypothetical protein [Catellatospora vulcania]|uniref:hypothetical protein n=1 Tax=Catellatospora vulcania TaxID=1460450 RepID=UPI0012D398D0|nr:hypothetical protein [Catellatospora vulcania]